MTVDNNIFMRKILIVFAALVLLASGAQAQEKGSKNYVIGFYNLENLFDTYNDPAKNDEEFLPDGKNQWTEVKYQKKLQNMAKVIRSMKEENGAWHALLGVSEIENRLVLEDLVMEPQIAEANYQIIHYDGPDRRGVDVALLYKPEVFTLRILEKFDLTRYFHHIGAASLDSSRSQKADVIRHALHLCGNPSPETVVMIGDRWHDIHGARANGIQSIGVLYGYGDRPELEQAGADVIAQSVEHLHALLLSK